MLPGLQGKILWLYRSGNTVVRSPGGSTIAKVADATSKAGLADPR